MSAGTAARSWAAATHPLVLAALAVGIALRIWAYLDAPALWLDELMLNRGIIYSSAWDLLVEPLQHRQVAPRGFVLLQKAAVALFGTGELALRAVPFALGILSLVVWLRVAARILAPAALPVAAIFLAITPTLVRYSAEAKQYGADVAVAGVLVLGALRYADARTVRNGVALGALGLVLFPFSHASVFVMAGIGLALFVTALRAGRPSLLALAPVALLWAIAAALAVAGALASVAPETQASMQEAWTRGGAFVPADAPGRAALRRHLLLLARSPGEVMRGAYPVYTAAGYIVVAALGLLVIARRRMMAAGFLVLPAALAYASSAMGRYPFSGRLVLFALPGLLIACAAALGYLAELLFSLARARIARARRAVPWVAAAGALPAIVHVVQVPPVYNQEDVKPVLSYVARRAGPGDALWLPYADRHVAAFYVPRYGLEGITTASPCADEDRRCMWRELEGFAGRRVWVLFAHTFHKRDSAALVDGLRMAGPALDSVTESSRHPRISGAFAMLFDLRRFRPDSSLGNAVSADSVVATPDARAR